MHKEDNYLWKHDTVLPGRALPKFRKNVPLPSSMLHSKPRTGCQ